MPKISVIMPVYNTQEEYLRESIESILNQTYKDFEFIIIDDGSTNNAAEVILSYPDERIKYFKNEINLGIIKTLNIGLDLVQGEYIARLDSDDISLPERFEKQAKFLDENQDVSILCSWFQWFPKNRIIKAPLKDKEIKEYLLINSNVIGHSTVMERHDFIKRNNLKYDDKFNYCEDYQFWLDAIDKANFACIPEILVRYRIHKNSICQKNITTQYLNIQKAMFLAQGKFFNIDSSKVLEVIKKLKADQKISTKDLSEIDNFTTEIKEKSKGAGFCCEYEINKKFYKLALKQCKNDFNIASLAQFSKQKIESQIEINQKPKVSAVMALYNTPFKYFKKTVKSIINQTFTDYELIIVDDASKIEYKTFLEKINDKRIKYIKLEKNSGPGYARNIGIKKALGDYIAIVDSDDIYMPKRFEQQVNFLDNNPDISLISGVFKFSDKNKKSSVLKNDEDIKSFMLINSALTNAAVMFKKQIFADKNLYYPEDLFFAEDYSLWVNAMFAGIKMANLDDVLMIYVRRKNQLSKEKKEKQISILKQIYKNIFLNLGFDASTEELDLHYNIYSKKYKIIKTKEIISGWFDKIIEHNRGKNVLSEDNLITKKELVLQEYDKYINRALKIKIGEFNLCMSKNFKFYIEKRD